MFIYNLAINFKDQISIKGFLSRKKDQCSNDGALLEIKEMKTYVQCNIQRQKLDPRCEIFVFTYQLYIFILVVYNVHKFFNNSVFVAK
jgi:hypothetical protein